MLSQSLEINRNPDEDYFNRNRLSGTWYLSEKIDGIRAIWHNNKLLTKSMRPFSWVPTWFLDMLPKDVSLDGEIIISNLVFSDFSTLSIDKSENDGKWKNVRYYVFDSPNAGGEFWERLTFLRSLRLNKEFIEIIDFFEIPDIRREFGKVNNMFENIVSRGGEGVMLINMLNNYEWGKRQKTILKYKKVNDDEAIVLELCPGKGKYEKVLGKVKCQLKDGTTFYCGSGFKDSQRKSCKFSNGTLVDNDKTFIDVGYTITFKYLEINKKTNVPRMPIFKAVRHINTT